MRHCDILSGRGQDLRTTEVKVVSDPKWKRLFFSLLFLMLGCVGEGVILIEWMDLISGRPTLTWWLFKVLGLLGSGAFMTLALRGRVRDPEEEDEGK